MRVRTNVDIDVSVDVDVHELDLCADDIAEILIHFSSDLSRAIQIIQAYARRPCRQQSAAKSCLKILAGDGPLGWDEIEGLHWSEAEELVERGDVDAIQRWLRPRINQLAPKPTRYVGDRQ